MDKYLTVFLTGLVVTYLTTPLVRSLARRYGVVDVPDARRMHKQPTARGGGLAVFLGFHAACLIGLLFTGSSRPGGFDLHWWLAFLPSSLLLLVVGLVDDVYGLSAWKKLTGQVVAALLIALSGTHFGSLFGYRLPPFLDGLLVVIWIVAVINAYNLIDGLDGLASGLAIITATGLCGILLLGDVPGTVLVLVALIGSCLAFLRYNFHPASIFLGDTGSMSIGLILGVVSLQTFTKNTFFLALTIPLLVLGVPIYDAFLAIWRRSMRLWFNGRRTPGNPKRNGLMQADVEHLHHRLLKAGWTTRRVATLLWVGNALLVIAGLLITTFKSHAVGIFLIALLIGAYILMRHLAAIELHETGRALLAGLHRPTGTILRALVYPVWDMAWLGGVVAFSLWAFETPDKPAWEAWLLDLPIWVVPTFALLVGSRVYSIVWNRAHARDVFLVAVILPLGLLLSLGLALLIAPEAASKWFQRALLMAGASLPALFGARVSYRFFEEVMAWLKDAGEGSRSGDRVVLYGAGRRCALFLRERRFHDSGSCDGRVIAGLIDDEPSLHGRCIYGYNILGGRKDLPHLIARHHLTGIIITAVLTPAAQAALLEIAHHAQIRLTQWSLEERELAPAAEAERGQMLKAESRKLKPPIKAEKLKAES